MSNKFLVIGGAECVWRDIVNSQKVFIPDVVVAINDIGIYLPWIDHWATMHPEKMGKWLGMREANGFDRPKLWTATHKEHKMKDLDDFEVINSRGGGGLIGINVCRVIAGSDNIKVVLAGIPLNRTSHFNKDSVWLEAELYRRFWRGNKKLNGFVRSMSGWTKELLKEPDEAWLKEA